VLLKRLIVETCHLLPAARLGLVQADFAKRRLFHHLVATRNQVRASALREFDILQEFARATFGAKFDFRCHVLDLQSDFGFPAIQSDRLSLVDDVFEVVYPTRFGNRTVGLSITHKFSSD